MALFLTTLATVLSSMSSGAEAVSPLIYSLRESIQQQQPYTSDYRYFKDRDGSAASEQAPAASDYRYMKYGDDSTSEQPATSDLTVGCSFVGVPRQRDHHCFRFTTCPANSCPKPGQQCYDSFEDDCECNPGYVKQHGRCIPEPFEPIPQQCNYQCPYQSVRKPNRQCYDSFDDCECIPPYVKQHGICIAKLVQPLEPIPQQCNYQCPYQSVRKPNRQCYDSFDDCECNPGYVKQHDRCIPEPFEPIKQCNYQCPYPSVRKPNRQCYDSFDDCYYPTRVTPQCPPGAKFDPQSGSCYYVDYDCPPGAKFDPQSGSCYYEDPSY